MTSGAEGTIPGNAFIDVCGQLARETFAMRPRKENVEILHDFVKSQLKPRPPKR